MKSLQAPICSRDSRLHLHHHIEVNRKAKVLKLLYHMNMSTLLKRSLSSVFGRRASWLGCRVSGLGVGLVAARVNS